MGTDVASDCTFTCPYGIGLPIFLSYLWLSLFLITLATVVLRMRRDRRKHYHDKTIRRLEKVIWSFEKSVQLLKEDDPYFTEENALLELLRTCLEQAHEIRNMYTEAKKTNLTTPRGIGAPELASIKIHPDVLEVRVFKRNGIDSCRELERELLNKLNDCSNVKIKFVECDGETQHQLGGRECPVFVFCLAFSRLGADAVNAMKGFKSVGKNVALLVFNHKEEHALPTTPSASKLDGDEFRNLGGIFDLAYTKSSGLYNCKMNGQAMNDLVNFLGISK